MSSQLMDKKRILIIDDEMDSLLQAVAAQLGEKTE